MENYKLIDSGETFFLKTTMTLLVVSLVLLILVIGFSVSHEKEAYNRRFQVNVYKHMLEINEGRSESKNAILSDIREVDVHRLDDESRRLLDDVVLNRLNR